MVLRWRAQYVKRTALSTIEIALRNNKVSRQGRACPDLARTISANPFDRLDHPARTPNLTERRRQTTGAYILASL